ncbi:hypothetical protein B0A48_10507 [Cryoendolithus antarcticus]|uniref:Zn(2)-C6 fungal-type domain-containing protein n=1 Tax=Cryoendolithus antarcticus TaxID=1507870 RepID=A0A1V8SXH5_9PEZI|nr:hypothetical protein B0A48_10507 [Cryoendolithus antarcticus]
MDRSMSHGYESAHGRLACQPCQRKKIKCDRTGPVCGQCIKSNLHCVPSSRKQRVRHAGKRAVDGELRSRISKLESLVESLSGEGGPADAGVEPDAQEQRELNCAQDKPDATPAVNRFVASSFWSVLSTEVQGLRDALEDDNDGDTPESGSKDVVSPSGTSANPSPSLEYDMLVCPPGRVYVMPGALQDLPPETSDALFHAFMDGVERILKIFNRPTLSAFMLHGADYLGQSPDSPSNLALKRIVWFGAVTAMSDQECQKLLGKSRMEALDNHRRLVDISLAQAELLNTTDFALLQGFCTYLTCARASDSTRRIWTLTAVLVRLAAATGMYHEDSSRSPFDRELRRRLFHRIRYLDVFLATDRGSRPLIDTSDYSVPFPHANNDDWDEQSESIPHYTKCHTEMSFALMAFIAVSVGDSLSQVDVQPSGTTWELRHQVALDFDTEIRDKFLQYCDVSDPFQRFLQITGCSISASCVLRALRPLQVSTTFTPPRLDSNFVLQAAIENLRSSERMYEDPEAERWRWMIWVQWVPVAVALAGLCSVRGTPVAEQAWYYVERQYARWMPLIADSKEGMLWKPIERLYRKALNYRNAGGWRPVTADKPMELDPSLQKMTMNETTPATTGAIPDTMTVAEPVSFDPTMMNQGANTLDYIAQPGAWDTFSIDPSWGDWEQIMTDFAGPNDQLENTFFFPNMTTFQ